MRLIPAIDIIDGKCVRLTKGDFSTKKVYRENPLDVAKEFEDHGIQYLHLVDLDGAKSKQVMNHGVLESITKETNLKVDFGGGLKSSDDVRIAFEAGASQITLGSVAVNSPTFFMECLDRYSSDKIILGADCKLGKIATDGWLTNTEVAAIDFIKDYVKKGVEYVVCTDILRDGMLKGASLQLYRSILRTNDIKLIASGGVSSVADLQDLKDLGCEGAIVGKAIYERKISLLELSKLC